MDFGGAGQWLRLVVGGTGGNAAVKSVAVQGSGGSSWQQLTNSWGATWETGNAPAPPLTFKVCLQFDWNWCNASPLHDELGTLIVG
jgi:hypothetical protein